MPPLTPAFTPAFGCVLHLTGYPPQMCGPRMERSHLSPEVLAQGWVMLSHPSSLGDLIRQSEELPPHFPAAPVIATVLGIQGPSCLPPRPSGLSLLYFPELPPSASAGSPNTCASVLPYQHWPSGKGGKPLATPNVRSNQLHAELAFDDWFVRFRYGPSVCSPRWADQT